MESCYHHQRALVLGTFGSILVIFLRLDRTYLPGYPKYLWDFSWIQYTIGNPTVCGPHIKGEDQFSCESFEWFSGDH